jgi:hypothetical protein
MRALECRDVAEEDRDPPPPPLPDLAPLPDFAQAALESDIDYLARRARHERELAAQAASPKAAMAHMYLAAAYAGRIAELGRMPESLESLLDQMP